MKHKVEVGDDDRTLSDEMRMGELAVISSDCRYDGEVIARVWSADEDVVELVSLNDPRSTWVGEQFRVRILPPGSQITITVGAGA